jgi:hypothetical protein
MIKAEEFAKKLNDEEFLCSASCIDRFRLGHSISFEKVSGEACCSVVGPTCANGTHTDTLTPMRPGFSLH